jgi:hypothetical protein
MQFSFGSVAMPDDWQVQLQVELIEPVRALSAPLPKAVALPPANIIIRRGADDQSPMACAAAMLRDLQAAVVALHHQPIHEVGFDDGAVGAAVEVSFQSPSLAAVVQTHWFRKDSVVITHLCATATTSAGLVPLTPLMKSFRPS